MKKTFITVLLVAVVLILFTMCKITLASENTPSNQNVSMKSDHKKEESNVTLDSLNKKNSNIEITPNYNKPFGYNSGFNIIYSNKVSEDMNQYKDYLQNELQQMYANKSDVLIKVSNMFISYTQTSKRVEAIYTITMSASDSAKSWYTSEPETISFKIGTNNTNNLTATLPNSWSYLESSVTEDGVTIPSGTSYVNINSKDGQNYTMYMPSASFGSQSNQVKIYGSLSNAKNNIDSIYVSTKQLKVIGIIGDYVEVAYTNPSYLETVQEIGFINYNGSGLELNDFNRPELNSQTANGVYNSTIFTMNPSSVQETLNSGTLLEYPMPESKVVETLKANQEITVFTNTSGNGYTLAEVNGKLGFINSQNINETSGVQTPELIYKGLVNIESPIGYKLILTGQSGEGSNSGMLENAMDKEFDGTGDVVTVTDTGGQVGMMHSNVYYNLTYKTPQGKVITQNNQEIQGIIDPQDDSFAARFIKN